jgi:hypothetical protein
MISEIRVTELAKANQQQTLKADLTKRIIVAFEHIQAVQRVIIF